MALTATFAAGAEYALNAISDIVEKGGKITDASQVTDIQTVSVAAQASETTDANYQAKVVEQAFAKIGTSI